MRAVRPQRAVYSRRLGTKDPLPRSAWSRSKRDHVGIAERVVEVGRDLDGPALERGRQQAARRGQRDVGAECGVGQHLGAGHPAVPDVADDQDAQTLEAAHTQLLGRGALALGQDLAHREAVDAAPGSGARASRRRR